MTALQTAIAAQNVDRQNGTTASSIAPTIIGSQPSGVTLKRSNLRTTDGYLLLNKRGRNCANSAARTKDRCPPFTRGGEPTPPVQGRINPGPHCTWKDIPRSPLYKGGCRGGNRARIHLEGFTTERTIIHSRLPMQRAWIRATQPQARQHS